jgi:hypothetical protein
MPHCTAATIGSASAAVIHAGADVRPERLVRRDRGTITTSASSALAIATTVRSSGFACAVNRRRFPQARPRFSSRRDTSTLLFDAYLSHAGVLAASRQRGHAVGADLAAAFSRPSGFAQPTPACS